MIPMSCPSCGRRGNVPLDRLNTQMHCKKCDAFFYLDASGKPIIGHPPSSKGKGGKSSSDRDKNEPTDYIGAFAGLLMKLPKQIWMVLGAGLAIYVLSVLYSTFFKPEPLTPSEIYSKRAREVAEAFLNKDTSALGYMASPGTEKELQQLAELHRADVGDGKSTMEGVTIFPGIPPAMVDDSNPVGTEVILIRTDPSGKPAAPYNLHLYWLYIKGELLVEGKKSLERAQQESKLKKKK